MAWGSTEKAGSYTANAEIRPDDDEDIEAFFTRNRFDGKTREACDEYARMRFPGVEATPSSTQGYCSYTLSLSKDYLLQFRPVAFMLNMNTCREAKAIYGRYAPTTTYLGEVQGMPLQGRDGHVGPPMMHVYLHKRIPGIPLSEFRRRKDGMKGREAEAEDRIYKRRLMRGLAKVFALGFRARQPFKECISKGRIGESMQWRLSLLKGLPSEDADLQRHVSEAQSQFHGIQASDWCLTHGDLLPANILVHPKTGRLTGLIDWAEAEWLPFGMALYGIEEVLGETVVPSSQGFRYYADHRELRHLFWCEFSSLTGQRRMSAVQVQRVEAARKLGILLWRGIAFDDGRMDRVVEEGRDEEEMQKLRLFLGAPGVSEGSGRVRDKREFWHLGHFACWMKNTCR